MGADEALRFIPSMRVEGACASGGLAFASAFEAIQAGVDVTLVAGAEVQTTASAREGGDYLARAADYKRQRPLDDFTFPAIFAQRLQAYTKKFNVDPKDVARISIKAYANANKNPLAHMVRPDAPCFGGASVGVAHDRRSGRQSSTWRRPPPPPTRTPPSSPTYVALALVLRSSLTRAQPELKDALRVSDCSQVSDGGAALVMVSEAGLKALGKSVADAVEVLTVQVATDNLYKDGALEAFETTKAAAARAYAQTGLGPKSIQVAEVHDCFTIAEVLMYEALGFAAPGQGVSLIKNGVTTLDGALPVNTGGGLIGFGHPVGATGVKQVLEVVKQLNGQAGAYQVKNKPQVGLTANMGGSDKTAVVSILRKGGARAAL